MTAFPQQSLKILQAELADPHLQCHWLAGDGSDRSYFRIVLSDKSTLVLMQLSQLDGDKLRANKYEWILIAELLSETGLKVPKLIKPLPEINALVIEDYGDLMLQDRVTQLLVSGDFAKVENYYLKCADAICSFLKVSNCSSDRWLNRIFDVEKLEWELKFFVDNYLKPVFEGSISELKLNEIYKDIANISKFGASFSKFLVHRDFHSRNVMLLEEEVAIIDFQDARSGPSTYDVVSLIFDSYVPLTGEQRSMLLYSVGNRIKSSFDEQFALEFDQQIAAVLLQRQLKAIGSFGYLTIRKNKGNYLKYVKPAIQTLKDYPVFDERWPTISGELLDLVRQNL